MWQENNLDTFYHWTAKQTGQNATSFDAKTPDIFMHVIYLWCDNFVEYFLPTLSSRSWDLCDYHASDITDVSSQTWDREGKLDMSFRL
jgi:hypothetical protein